MTLFLCRTSVALLGSSALFIMYISLLLLYLQAWTVLAATAAQWRGRSIYQVLTDRYARTDGSTTASCNTGNRAYCGGTWRGLINKLDYIKNMGFTAVIIICYFFACARLISFRSGSRLLPNRFKEIRAMALRIMATGRITSMLLTLPLALQTTSRHSLPPYMLGACT